jgi:hypothetical protein
MSPRFAAQCGRSVFARPRKRPDIGPRLEVAAASMRAPLQPANGSWPAGRHPRTMGQARQKTAGSWLRVRKHPADFADLFLARDRTARMP